MWPSANIVRQCYPHHKQISDEAFSSSDFFIFPWLTAAYNLRLITQNTIANSDAILQIFIKFVNWKAKQKLKLAYIFEYILFWLCI